MTATAASAGLVDALKDSLANSGHGWSVIAASDVDGLSVTLAAAGLLQSGDATRVIYRTPAKGPRVILLKSGSSWTVPADWDSASNSIEVLGAGGGGAASGAAGSGGGYSKIANLALTPGATVAYAVGAGGVTATAGGDTWFNGASFGAASVAAKGGGHSGAAGGAAADGIGTTKYSGGNGGASTASGGGGAAGPNGNGGNGASASGGGGGGANGGGNGSAGIGGNGPSGSGGGTRTRPPTNGGGGAGAYYDQSADPGSQQDIWIGNDGMFVGSAAVAGPGGGGGGGMYTSLNLFVSGVGNHSIIYFADASSGGGYGAGGGGGMSASMGGCGSDGLIVITYGASAVSQLDFGGAQYTVSDTALDTTIKVLAAAFLAASDEALTELFTTGTSGSGGGSTTTVLFPASEDLIDAIKASLADPAAQWTVTGRAVNVIREAQGKGGTSGVSTAVSRIDHVVTLSSPLIRVAVGARAPLAFCYIGSTTPAGVYASSEIYIDGKLFTTVDYDLHGSIMDLAEAERLALDTAVTDSLALGPQTFGG